MNGKLIITVGEGRDDADRRILDTVRRAKAGTPVGADTRLNFSSWKQLFSMLNSNRMEVLHYVHEHDPKSINSVATGLKRSYRRVHQDVSTLLDLGLIDRHDDGSLGVGYDPDKAIMHEEPATAA